MKTDIQSIPLREGGHEAERRRAVMRRQLETIFGAVVTALETGRANACVDERRPDRDPPPASGHGPATRPATA
ncbi:hypothetical protein [Oricola thermophila]|uniref:Uncharacterized protein n=1 Tax=Oricola thermophila TaxID=2742145 RepID=A0A6N1VD91_9HYPH|nr:hypothetical protein [Oricola thermophila]QKV18981.1 hypothetical protein HTY61_11220 [Oricola thermophila]